MPAPRQLEDPAGRRSVPVPFFTLVAAVMIKLRAKIQIYRDDEIAFGPGKADLLDAIESAGSIAAAAREFGMSYRRAWLLVDVMNHCFRSALVETDRGGSGRGGARLTRRGKSVLSRYRTMQAAVDKVANAHFRKFSTEMSRS